MRPFSRFVTAGMACATVLLLPPGAARAGDGGSHHADAAEEAGEHADTSRPRTDATPDGAATCIAVGEPCTHGETCCNESAYCGSFGGAGGSLVCGLDSANNLSTGSCSATGVPGAEGAWLVGAVGLAIAAGVRRKRRAPSRLSPD